MTEFEHVTTNAIVEIYDASSGIFKSLILEVKELSKKKPEAVMSSEKVKIINRVLDDLLIFLKTEPTGKYLDMLDDEMLPQMSDAVLVMVQFNSALESFQERYRQYLGVMGGYYWITQEQLAEWDEEGRELRTEWEEDENEDEDVG